MLLATTVSVAAASLPVPAALAQDQGYGDNQGYNQPPPDYRDQPPPPQPQEPPPGYGNQGLRGLRQLLAAAAGRPEPAAAGL